VKNNKTIERQSAAKAVAEIFHGEGPLTEQEEEQYKRLTEDVADFNKRGRFTELHSSEQEEKQTQRVEIEVSTDGGENPEKDTEEGDEEE
jgi:hypothetical protein